MHRRPDARLRLLVAGALVALLTLALVRGTASGAHTVAADRGAAAQALLPPSPLPSLLLPLPSVNVPLPSIDLGSPLPSGSLPLPSVPEPSVPQPSVSVPLPSLSPLPSVSLPIPSASVEPPGSQPPSIAAATRPGGASAVTSTPTPSPSDRAGSPVGSARGGGGVGDDRRPSSGAGRAGALDPSADRPSWLVPSLAFGVPLLLAVGAVLTQLAGGAAVLGVARRVMSRIPGPTPRWMRGASDADGG